MRDHSATHSSSQAGDWVLDTARRNPEALLLVAAGCCLLMRSGSSWSKAGRTRNVQHEHDTGTYRSDPSYQATDTSESMARKAGETISRAADSAGEYASNVKQRVTKAASSYADTVSRYTQDTGRSLYEQSRQAQSTLQESVSRIVREQPFAVAVVGLAAGAALAAIFPSTRIENRTFGGTREALAEAAGRAGENLMEAATEAGQRFVSGVAQRGLSSEGLKDLAGEVAETFSNAVTGKAGEGSPSIAPQSPGAGSDVGRSSMAPAANQTGGRSKP
jgi:ElaB/YqjD/DUF883 family membrane-anchored ribosome-binding protein